MSRTAQVSYNRLLSGMIAISGTAEDLKIARAAIVQAIPEDWKFSITEAAGGLLVSVRNRPGRGGAGLREERRYLLPKLTGAVRAAWKAARAATHLNAAESRT